jgi:choline dehydrogenase-like flavoprotein
MDRVTLSRRSLLQAIAATMATSATPFGWADTVVVLEQGPRLSLRSFRHDELKDWYLGGITNDAVKNPQTFRDDGVKRAELQKFKPALWYGRAVGGASLHYTANYWRLRD